MPAPHDPPPRPGPPSTFDFELTDFETARAAHDSLPAGVEKIPVLTPGFWESRRRRPGPADRALTGTTIDWCLSLPPSRRPHRLCELFPRVANGLALRWRAPAARNAMLDELLADRRGGRRGFPADVRQEIERLREA